jgi:hypothetical protein
VKSNLRFQATRLDAEHPGVCGDGISKRAGDGVDLGGTLRHNHTSPQVTRVSMTVERIESKVDRHLGTTAIHVAA